MKPKAVIESAREGETVIVRARYSTPEWVLFLETVWWPVTLGLWLATCCAAWWALGKSGHMATNNEAVFWGGVVAAAAFGLCWGAVRSLMRVGGGFGSARPGRLIIRIARERISWEGAGRTGAIDREGWTVRFLPRPHRRGRDEERDSINVRNAPAVSYAYRDGWEIWMQVGERFFDLAAASTEADADAIVRRLQAADLEVTRPRQGARRTA